MGLEEMMIAREIEPTRVIREDTAEPRRGERVIDSRTLFGPAREIRITHNGESYSLRLTRLGKLILTK